MKPRTNGVPRAQKSRNFQGEGPNWVLLAGGALLSTLSIRLGYKLKQALDTKQQENASNGLKGFFISKALASFLSLPASNIQSYLKIQVVGNLLTEISRELVVCIQMHILLPERIIVASIVFQVWDIFLLN